MGRAVAVVVAAAVLAAGLSGCSNRSRSTPGQEAGSGLAGVPTGPTVAAVAGSDGAVHAEVGGMRLDGPAGSLSGGAEVAVAPVRPPSPPGSIEDVPVGPVADGVEVHVRSGQLLGPLTVRFPAAKAAPDESVVAVHRADDGTWSLLGATIDGGDLVVSTASFSIVSWTTAKLLKPVGDFMAEKLAGRTDPPDCSGPPSWASVNGSPSGSTHACVRAGKPLADGTPVVELEVKSNRGTYQWVHLPSTLKREYVWIEDQNDYVRAAIRKVFGRGETVLLGPGQRMTIGYRQPVAPTQLALRTYADTAAGVMSAARLSLDAITDDAVSKIGGYVVLLTCFGVLKINLADSNNPVKLVTPDLFVDLTKCVYETVADFAEHPNKAVEAVSDLLGPTADGATLTEGSLGAFKLGKLAALVGKIILLGTYVLKELSFIVDALNSGIGADNAGDVTLTLMALRSPPTPTSRPAFVTPATCRAEDPVLSRPGVFEFAARCLYGAWRAGDRKTAERFAETLAIKTIFEVKPTREWKFTGCDQSNSRTGTYLGNACSFIETQAGPRQGQGITFSFVAYDDVIVVSDLDFK